MKKSMVDDFITNILKIKTYDEKCKLDNKEVDVIELTHTNPSFIEDIFGQFIQRSDMNEYCEYHAINKEYKIIANTYTGNCKITRRGDDK